MSSRPTDVHVAGVQLYFLPVQTRVPLKFGAETLTSVTCARACVTVSDRSGRTAVGWGETPLNIEWAWPSSTSYSNRHKATLAFCATIARRWADFTVAGHPLEIGDAFQRDVLPKVLEAFRIEQCENDHFPLLAGLLCCSPFDIATYDAYGKLHELPIFDMLTDEYCNKDLAYFLQPASDSGIDFRSEYPDWYLVRPPARSLPAWHLVGGLDALSADEVPSNAPNDGHPLLLQDWIARDGLQCLKVKLQGVDHQRDYERLVRVGRVAEECGGSSLSADFNCTVHDPKYVVDILDRLARDEPGIYSNILYIEQPFPYELERYQIDVREISARKPLLMDESAHNWELVRLGRSLGWTGVALKTCKTLTGALLSLCWAKAHGMDVMVQDLTNPMLAQIPHLLLAAHIETLMGVETNAMQFYPAASDLEAQVHPGIYQRRNGRVDLLSLQGPGFGYRVEQIARPLPKPAVSLGDTLDDLF